MTFGLGDKFPGLSFGCCMRSFIVNASPPRCPGLAQECWNGAGVCRSTLYAFWSHDLCCGLLTPWLRAPAGPRRHGPWPVMEPGDIANSRGAVMISHSE
jgi:hypothetical protein